MKHSRKNETALDKLVENYVDGLEYVLNHKFPPKKRKSLITLAKNYFRLRESLNDSGEFEPLSAACKFDRMVIFADELDPTAIATIPGYRAQKPEHLWNKAYAWAQRSNGTGSIEEVVVEYESSAPWFPPYRITIIPRDSSGLHAQDLQLILEHFEKFRISILEVSWDFPAECLMDLEYVRRFGLFGKTRLQPRSGNPFHEKWGNAASKVVRAYTKWEIFQFRVELELHTGFLQKAGIRDIFDFHKLIDVLLPHHIAFYELGEKKLIRELQRNGKSTAEQEQILSKARRKARSRLWSALRFLRKECGLKNVRRLLKRADGTDRVIREALEKLIAAWPKAPAPPLEGPK
jgi:hypothetical protein